MTMPECLKRFSPTECIAKVNQEVDCKLEFDKFLCSGWSWIGHGGDAVKCCVKTKYSLTRPDDKVPPFPYTMSSLASLYTVFATLCIWWAMNNTPMLPASGTTSSFTSGVWLDVMDSITFLQNYATYLKLLELKYGIGDTGAPIPIDKAPYRIVMGIALIAFISSILAPTLYILCRKENADDDSSSSRSVDECLADAAIAVRLLDSDGANQRIKEAIELQQDQYRKDSNDTAQEFAVTVFPEQEEGAFLSSTSKPRSGTAVNVGKGLYDVRYTDNEEPSSEFAIPVLRIRPELEASHSLSGSHCCSGWCHRSRLSNGNSAENFEARATFFEACRSLLLLELPFFVCRFHFEASKMNVFSFSWVLMLKNFVWGLMDVLTIIGFGNTHASCLGFAPIEFMKETVEGTSLGKLFVGGEGGIILIGHQLLQKALTGKFDKDIKIIQSHRAWLLVERAKSLERGDTTAVTSYDKRCEELDELLASIEDKKSLRVM
eukprot:TRINITY_DN23586_c0_g1_i1.p1 TRINITY_DN23586_c0_g1~~TRINITY_DN23586_c0_g1_i1.p1  ORF type:complete len:539 (+),score=61.15 TRINITY_DN23586_c0_g1_i1:148-1617(+)